MYQPRDGAIYKWHLHSQISMALKMREVCRCKCKCVRNEVIPKIKNLNGNEVQVLGRLTNANAEKMMKVVMLLGILLHLHLMQMQQPAEEAANANK